MKRYPQYLWFVVLALLLVCTGCSNEGETEDDNNQNVKVEGSQLGFQEQSNWSEKMVQVSLAAGINQIAFQRDAGDNGQFYLDYIEID